jgi:hypothetical protein
MTQPKVDSIQQFENAQRTRVFRLRRGQTQVVTCGMPTNTRTFTIRPGEALVVTCRATRRRFIFTCRGFRTRRTITRMVPNNTRISVTCM